MARSYRKNVFDSYVCYSRKSMKAWRSQENRRLRRSAKQIINSCVDYDNLIIPVLNDFDTLWGSPQDGKKHRIPKPLLNQCEWDAHIKNNSWRPMYTYWLKELKEYQQTGHLKYCECYTNKRSYYWKLKRK